MARIRPLTKAEASPEAREIIEQVEARLGKPLISVGIQALCPPILQASAALGAAPSRSGKLPGQLRALVCLRAAQLVGCPF